jgi:hypothetical protein
MGYHRIEIATVVMGTVAMSWWKDEVTTLIADQIFIIGWKKLCGILVYDILQTGRNSGLPRVLYIIFS